MTSTSVDPAILGTLDDADFRLFALAGEPPRRAAPPAGSSREPLSRPFLPASAAVPEPGEWRSHARPEAGRAHEVALHEAAIEDRPDLSRWLGSSFSSEF